MAEADTDKIDPTKPMTAAGLVDLLSKASKSKKGDIANYMQLAIVALFALGGTGIGQSFFGVSKETFQAETAALKTQNVELLKEVGNMKERMVRLETKIEQGGK